MGLATFASLRHRDFRLLWLGTCFMSAGQWIQQVTLGWLVYDLTSSAALLGLIGAVRALPFLVVSPTAGVIADRVDRRVIILAAESFLVAAAVVMGTIVVSGQLQVWHLFVFTIATGTAWSFNQPARMALVPNVVPEDDLMNAIALNSLGFNLTKVIGPSLGGVLIAVFGAGGNFFVQAAAYAAVLVVVYLMRVPPTPSLAGAESVLQNLREGLAYVRATPTVLALLLLTLIPSILALPYMSLMPVFARDVLGLGPDALGLMLAAPGLGAVVSTLFVASYAYRMERRGPFLLGALVLLGISLILFSQTTELRFALAALFGVGCFHIFFGSITNAMIQQIIPDELRGRVTSIYMLEFGLTPAGTLLAGATTEGFGGPLTVAMMGASVLTLAIVVTWRFPEIRRI
ncbi:MAG: MFS transporter [Chloroflexi bacterium]|nr:MFS transporter [Chloroflexota bacterium]